MKEPEEVIVEVLEGLAVEFKEGVTLVLELREGEEV